MGFLKNKEELITVEFLRCFFERILSGDKGVRLFGKDSRYSFLIQPNYIGKDMTGTVDGYIQVNLGKDGEDDYRVAGSLEKEGLNPCFTDIPLGQVTFQIAVWMVKLGISEMIIPQEDKMPGFEFSVEEK